MDYKRTFKFVTATLFLLLFGVVMAQLAPTGQSANAELRELLQAEADLQVDLNLQIEDKQASWAVFSTSNKMVEAVMSSIEVTGGELRKLKTDSQTRVESLLNSTKDETGIPASGNFTPTAVGGIDEFLKVNGADFVKEAGDIFRAAGLLYNLEPEILVCIAQADSSLGKALKTSYNIGNVGNTDSGATKHYSDLESGIAGIAQTLNNQYMYGLTFLGQLSQGGRNVAESEYSCSNAPSPYKCYATSEFNWNKNVKTCLQNILQDPTIDEFYKFRN